MRKCLPCSKTQRKLFLGDNFYEKRTMLDLISGGPKELENKLCILNQTLDLLLDGKTKNVAVLAGLLEENDVFKEHEVEESGI